jgi:ubiquitin
MKHLESLFDEISLKAQTNKALFQHYHNVSMSLRVLYPNVNIMEMAQKAIGAEQIMPKPKEPRAIREQSAAEYDLSSYQNDSQDCPTCGKNATIIKQTRGQKKVVAFDAVIEPEVIPEPQSIIPGSVETIAPSSDDPNESELIEKFIRENDTESFTAYLKLLGVKVSKKNSIDLDKLVQIYEDYKQG